MNFNLKTVKHWKNGVKVAHFTNTRISDGSYGYAYPPSRSLMTLHKPNFLSFTVTLERTLNSIFLTDGKYWNSISMLYRRKKCRSWLQSYLSLLTQVIRLNRFPSQWTQLEFGQVIEFSLFVVINLRESLLVTIKSNGYISTRYKAGEISKCMTVLFAFT